jgi:hypothetical protein
MPELITETLLVVERFKHKGEEYDRGDRLPVRHRWVRRVAAEHPDWFRAEYAPEDVDRHWLASLEDDSEARYQAVLRAREEGKARHERAQRDEPAEQNASQPDLERRIASKRPTVSASGSRRAGSASARRPNRPSSFSAASTSKED